MSGQGMIKAKLQFAEVWFTFCVMEIDNLRDHTLKKVRLAVAYVALIKLSH